MCKRCSLNAGEQGDGQLGTYAGNRDQLLEKPLLLTIQKAKE